jgi:uncharacterized circularly permuted ATP-grasp superfamily protein
VALFYRTLQTTLACWRALRDNRIVLLTPGPYNETYFEHAFLARYLGYTLVEGGDLTARDGRVFLKVLGGLQPVDVIFRRLDDDFCDPLELRPDSFLGVPGLMHAVRSGNVAVANALGSGLLETPALLAFLSGLCRRLLREECASHPWRRGGAVSRPRWSVWHLPELVIKPVFASARMEPLFGDKLSREGLRAVAARIRAGRALHRPERVALSTAPVLSGGRMEPRPVVLRIPDGEDDSFVAMPGGLTRFALGGDAGGVDAARRRQQGHMGAVVRPGQLVQHAAAEQQASS